MSDKINVRKYIELKFHIPYKQNSLLTRCWMIILSLALFSSCVDDNFSLGKEYLKGNMRIVYVDTCTAVIKTVWEDSIITSGLGYVWAGKVNDPVFGKTTAISYLPFRFPDFARHEFYQFDSATFSIKYTADYYGDTLPIQKYSLYRLTEEFSETAEKFRYYSTESVPMDSLHPMLSDFQIKPAHALKKYKTIRLPNNFWEGLLGKFMDEEDLDMKDSKSFANYFSGLAMKPSNNNNLISSFSAKTDSSIFITIYYHYYLREKDKINNVDKQKSSITMIINKDRQFNQVRVDRTGTSLASLNYKKHELISNASTTNNQVYIQGLTGLSMEMEFPYLKSLNLLGQNVGILGVNLILRPVKGTYDKQYPLPDSLALVVLNKADDKWGAGAMRINKDEMNYGMNTDYEIDVTSFFKDQLKAFGVDQKRVKFGNRVQTLDGFLRRVVLANDQKNFNDRLKIEIKLIIYAD